MDGTLVDTAPGITRSVAHTLAVMGWPAEDEATLLRHAGPPLTHGFEVVSGMTHDQALEATRIYRERYVRLGVHEARVFDGIPETLATLKGAGVPLAVSTSKIEETAYPMLDSFSLRGFFDVVTGSDDTQGRSTKADVVREALRRLREAGLDASRPVLIGDRSYDVEGARQAGVPTIGALWGYAQGPDELVGAVALAERPGNVIDILTLAAGPAR